jgi:hypothetical protein
VIPPPGNREQELFLVAYPRIFERWEFGAFAIAALAATTNAHGSICLRRRRNAIFRGKFLMALPAGRMVRYSLPAFLAARYGWQILTTVISRLGQPVRIAIIGVIAVAIAALFFIFLRKRNMRAHV